MEPLKSGDGVWLEFNQKDQKAIRAGGTAAAIGLIGLIGGPVAGVIASTLGAVVATYISDHGICSKDRNLRIEGDWEGRLTDGKCVG